MADEKKEVPPAPAGVGEPVQGEKSAEIPTEQTSKSDTKEAEAAENKGPKNLDLAFAMDCTGSMGSYIHQAQQNIRGIVEQIVANESADVRLALVEYRDHPPQDSSFVTRVNDFTSKVRQMKGWLDNCSASGGGDGPEAVADALHQVLKLSWRDDATKICVLISDAPPHGLSRSGDGFPDGCPDGLDPMQTTQELAQKGIALYAVGCEPSINTYKEFFMGLAHLTGGQYVPLGSAALLTQVILGGAAEEISLRQLMEEVNQEVVQELGGANDEEMEYEAVTKKVHHKLHSKGYKSKQLLLNKEALPVASSQAKMYSECMDMSEVRGKFEPVKSSHSSHYSRSGPAKKKKASKGSGGLMGYVGSFFGGGSKAKEEPSDDDDEEDGGALECDMMAAGPRPMAACMAGPMAAPKSSADDVYGCVEDEISEQQVSRMVQQSVWSNKLNTKMKKSSK